MNRTPASTGAVSAAHPRAGAARAGAHGITMAPHAPAASERAARALSAQDLVARLEEAGRTLLALPEGGWTTRLRTTRLDVVQAAAGALADGTNPRLRTPVPDAAAISRMDEAFAWLALIPEDRYVLRRILGARALTHPLTLRHLHSWRRIAALLGADHRAVQRWHADGITLIRRALASGERPAVKDLAGGASGR